MKINLDSTDNLKTIIKVGGHSYSRVVTSPKDQDVFGFLIDCLAESGNSLHDVSAIDVNAGPGTFTGTRIGVAIANALGYALNIPVNGSHEPVDPIYSSPPSITRPKAR